MQIKVLKPTKFYPVVGRTYDAEPSPRVRVLIHQGYIVKVDEPAKVVPVAVVEPDDAPGNDEDEPGDETEDADFDDELEDDDEPEDPENDV